MFPFSIQPQLLAAHQHEVEEALEKLDADRNRQNANLRAKLAEKKKKKMEALQRKQDREMARELMEQKKEINEARNEQVTETLYLCSFRGCGVATVKLILSHVYW